MASKDTHVSNDTFSTHKRTTEHGTTQEGSRGKKVCETDVCKERARFILNSIDRTLDPCVDFYEYVCGREIQRRPVTEDDPTWHRLTDMQEETKRDLKAILRNTPLGAGRSKALDNVVMAYLTCEDAPAPGEESLSALRTLLADIGVSLWPVWPPSNSLPPWNETLVKMARNLGLMTLFQVRVKEHGSYPRTPNVQLTPYRYNPLFAASSTPIDTGQADAYKDYIKEVVMFMNASFAEIDSAAVAEDLYNLEAKLYAVSTPSSNTSKLMYLHQQDLPNIDWLEFLNEIVKVVNISLTHEDMVIFNEWDFFEAALSLIDQVNRSTIHNYLAWTVISRVGSLAADALSRLHDDYVRSLKPDFSKKGFAGKDCVGDLQDYAGSAVGRLYVDRKFGADAREDVTNISASLKHNLRSLFEDTDWMDINTKSEAVRKVDRMLFKIGYPDRIKNDTFLEEQQQFVGEFTKGTPYVLVQNGFRRNAFLKSLQSIGVPINRKEEWQGSASHSNARYKGLGNYVQLEAGLLRSPAYGYGLPISCNLGAVGTIMGHEMEHGFGPTGSRLDADGLERNWWEKDAFFEFIRRQKCFVEQYANITDEETGLNIDGHRTLTENIADNAGLDGAFRVYRTYASKSEDLALPGLEDFTGEQIFFISNALIWCASYTTSIRKTLMETDVHSLATYRVNVPMGNMKEFSDTFGCSSGSTMNFKHRCKLWQRD